MDEFSKYGNNVYLTQLRRMFYLVTPNETSYKDVDDVPHFINESTPVFLSALLIEAILSFFLSENDFRLNDSITSSSAGLISRLPCVIIKSVHLTTYKWMSDNFCLIELPWNNPWTWFLTFLLVDFGYYWFHRMAHEVNLLWASHQVHHSSEDYNMSTALRQSVFLNFFSWVIYLPLAFAIPTSVFIVHDELNTLYQFWIHTQYVRSLGPLEYILNTPSHHRVHHGRNPYCIDKNYAGVLIIWDRLFGTFQAEEDKVVYGLVSQVNTFEPIEIQVVYFKKIFERIQNGENICSVLFKGPGWQPGGPRLGNPKDIPQIEPQIKKYNPTLPIWINGYILIHFLTMVGLFEYLLTSKHLMSQFLVLAGLLFILFSLSCFGRLFDRKWYAAYLEVIRCGIVLMTILLKQHNIPKNQFSFTRGLQFFYLTSTILWLFNISKNQKKIA